MRRAKFPAAPGVALRRDVDDDMGAVDHERALGGLGGQELDGGARGAAAGLWHDNEHPVPGQAAGDDPGGLQRHGQLGVRHAQPRHQVGLKLRPAVGARKNGAVEEHVDPELGRADVLRGGETEAGEQLLLGAGGVNEPVFQPPEPDAGGDEPCGNDEQGGPQRGPDGDRLVAWFRRDLAVVTGVSIGAAARVGVVAGVGDKVVRSLPVITAAQAAGTFANVQLPRQHVDALVPDLGPQRDVVPAAVLERERELAGVSVGKGVRSERRSDGTARACCSSTAFNFREGGGGGGAGGLSSPGTRDPGDTMGGNVARDNRHGTIGLSIYFNAPRPDSGLP